MELPIAPMLAKSVGAIPKADTSGGPFGYEPKWDGFRAVIAVGDEVEIYSRTGKSMTRYFPDVVAAARAELPSGVVVDGEIVVARGDSLDFSLLGQRIHPAQSRVAMLAEAAPANVVVFDVLEVGGVSVMDRPFSERLAHLDSLELTGPRVFATPRTLDADQAEQWFHTFEGAGLDGVMAKPLNAPYQPGKRAMLKIKHARTADVVLAGYREHKASTASEPLVGSLLLGLYADRQLHFVGVCASFPMARRAELVDELADLAVTDGDDHPWADWSDPGAHVAGRKPGAASRWSGGKDLSFVALRPERVLEVGYDHMEDGRFRHTTQFKRWRPDRDPNSCGYEQLEEVPGYDLAELLPGAPAAAADFFGAPPA